VQWIGVNKNANLRVNLMLVGVFHPETMQNVENDENENQVGVT